jgi:hypothetical protein
MALKKHYNWIHTKMELSDAYHKVEDFNLTKHELTIKVNIYANEQSKND